MFESRPAGLRDSGEIHRPGWRRPPGRVAPLPSRRTGVSVTSKPTRPGWFREVPRGRYPTASPEVRVVRRAGASAPRFSGRPTSSSSTTVLPWGVPLGEGAIARDHGSQTGIPPAFPYRAAADPLPGWISGCWGWRGVRRGLGGDPLGRSPPLPCRGWRLRFLTLAGKVGGASEVGEGRRRMPNATRSLPGVRRGGWCYVAAASNTPMRRNRW
jgi:hypothetical protein